MDRVVPSAQDKDSHDRRDPGSHTLPVPKDASYSKGDYEPRPSFPKPIASTRPIQKDQNPHDN